MQPTEDENYWQLQQEGTINPAEEVIMENEQEFEEEPPFEPINWEASEYIDHHRDLMWFVGFGVISILFLAFSVLIMKNYIFGALIVTMSIALLVYAKRTPRVTRYTLSAQGLYIGEKFHSFREYRAFGIIQDQSLFSVKLLPTARFGQDITIYFSENEGEEIVDILGAFLPIEDLHLDFVDSLLRRLRL